MIVPRVRSAPPLCKRRANEREGDSRGFSQRGDRPRSTSLFSMHPDASLLVITAAGLPARVLPSPGEKGFRPRRTNRKQRLRSNVQTSRQWNTSSLGCNEIQLRARVHPAVCMRAWAPEPTNVPSPSKIKPLASQGEPCKFANPPRARSSASPRNAARYLPLPSFVCAPSVPCSPSEPHRCSISRPVALPSPSSFPTPALQLPHAKRYREPQSSVRLFDRNPL